MRAIVPRVFTRFAVTDWLESLSVERIQTKGERVAAILKPPVSTGAGLFCDDCPRTRFRPQRGALRASGQVAAAKGASPSFRQPSAAAVACCSARPGCSTPLCIFLTSIISFSVENIIFWQENMAFAHAWVDVEICADKASEFPAPPHCISVESVRGRFCNVLKDDRLRIRH